MAYCIVASGPWALTDAAASLPYRGHGATAAFRDCPFFGELCPILRPVEVRKYQLV